ncbi:MAG: hypothetical protein WBF06_01610 [Candidatus Acidiferrales bacterium]
MRTPSAVIFCISSICALLLVAFCLPLVAQNDDDDIMMRLGPTPPSRPSMQIPMGEVNLENGNVHLAFPLLSYKQRNGQTVNLGMTYDSQFYSISSYPTGEGYNYVWNDATPDNSTAGWRFTGSPVGMFGSTTSEGSSVQCGNGSSPWSYQSWQNFVYIDPSGTEHQFGLGTLDNSMPACGYANQVTPGYAQDSSGYQISVTISATSMTAQIWDKHGASVCTSSAASYTGSTQYEYACSGNVEDSNGNFYFPGTSNLQDELGRQIPNMQCTANCSSSSPTYSYGGATIQMETIQVSTNFPAWVGGFNGTTQFTGPMMVVQSITLPDGRSYQFGYDGGTSPGDYGQMTSMTLPTGGEVGFTYQVVNPPNGDGFFVGDLKLATLTEQGATWGFNWSAISCQGGDPSLGNAALTVTDPADESGTENQSTYAFTYHYCPADYFILTQYVANFYAGSSSGTLLRSATYVEDDLQDVESVTTSIGNGMSSTSKYGYTGYAYLPDLVQVYDFNGNLLRETDVSYVQTSTYENQHILDLPSSISVYRGSGSSRGTMIAQTNFSYDATSLSSQTGATNHDDSNYSASQTVRGNLTGVSRMVSSGTFIPPVR